jgi:hypothetical protein
LYITEFDELVVTDHNVAPFGKLNSNTVHQRVAIGSPSAASNPFASTTTRFIRIEVDSACSIVYAPPGSTPTATATDARVAANARGEYLGVDAGGSVACITNSSFIVEARCHCVSCRAQDCE